MATRPPLGGSTRLIYTGPCEPSFATFSRLDCGGLASNESSRKRRPTKTGSSRSRPCFPKEGLSTSTAMVGLLHSRCYGGGRAPGKLGFQTASHVGRWRRELTIENNEQFIAIAGEQLAAYGYPLRWYSYGEQ